MPLALALLCGGVTADIQTVLVSAQPQDDVVLENIPGGNIGWHLVRNRL